MKHEVQNPIEAKAEILKVDDLEMNVVAHTVKRGGKEVRLNRKEFALLELFMRNADVLLTRERILDRVWDLDTDPFTNTVDAHVCFLRQKIDEGHRNKLIRTVYGFGYKLAE